MSRPKPFLEPDHTYARIKELERRVKTLETAPRTQLTGIIAAEILTGESLGATDAFAFHDLATPGPSVTVTTGPSGKVLVLASALVLVQANAGGNGTARFGVGLDGADPLDQVGTVGLVNIANLFVETNPTAIQLYTLTANASHTFRMMYRWESGTSAQWLDRSIVAIPI